MSSRFWISLLVAVLVAALRLRRLAPLLRLHLPPPAAVLRVGRKAPGLMVTPPRTGEPRRPARRALNRRPPSFAVTLIALAIVFALAWMFFVRSGSSTPAARRERRPRDVQLADDGAGRRRDARRRLRRGRERERRRDRSASRPGRPSTAPRCPSRPTTPGRGRRPRTEASARRVKLQRTVGAWPPVWRLSTPQPAGVPGAGRDRADRRGRRRRRASASSRSRTASADRLARRDDPGRQEHRRRRRPADAASSPGTATARSHVHGQGGLGVAAGRRARPGRWTRRPVRA